MFHAFILLGGVLVVGVFFVLLPILDRRTKRKEIEARQYQPTTPLQRQIRDLSIPAFWPFQR